MMQSPKSISESVLSSSPVHMASPPRAPVNSPALGAPRTPVRGLGELPDIYMASPPSSGMASPVTSPRAPELREQAQVQQSPQQAPQLFGLGLFMTQPETPQQGQQNQAPLFLFGAANTAINFNPATQPGLASRPSWQPTWQSMVPVTPMAILPGRSLQPIRPSGQLQSPPSTPALAQEDSEQHTSPVMPSPPRLRPQDMPEAQEPDRKRQRRD